MVFCIIFDAVFCEKLSENKPLTKLNFYEHEN